MKYIRSIICLIFLSSCWLSAGYVYSQEEKEGFSITEREVRINCLNYIEVLLKDKPPTLSSYRDYYSPHAESEYGAELNYCYKQWGQPFLCEKSELTISTECARFIQSRHANDGTVSLYLSNLQKILQKYKGAFRINAIRLEKRDKDISYYIVTGTVGKTPIELRHAASQMAFDLLGRVNIITLDNKDINKFEPPDKFKMPDCFK